MEVFSQEWEEVSWELGVFSQELEEESWELGVFSQELEEESLELGVFSWELEEEKLFLGLALVNKWGYVASHSCTVNRLSTKQKVLCELIYTSIFNLKTSNKIRLV